MPSGYLLRVSVCLQLEGVGESEGGLQYLLSSVDDVLGEGEAVDAGPPRHRVVARWGVGHLHSTELKEGLPEGYAAEQQLPGARQTKSTSYKYFIH